jgi:multicomponent Na+:H+ antiporter subunit E
MHPVAKIVYSIIAFAFWLLLTLSLDREHLVVGVVVCVLTALLFGRIAITQTRKLLQPQRYFWMVFYCFVLIWECIKANFDVAYRVLHPSMPIHPGIVKTRTSLKTDIGRTCLANSITMTPGTLSVDITDEGYLYIHWINVKTQDVEEASQKIVVVFEKILKRIFE